MTRPTLNVDSAGANLFDGLEAVVWFVHMRSNITAPRIVNISPGQLYTFVFAQDANGNHLMKWPANCFNAANIDPKPNSVTVQNFVGATGGNLYANAMPSGSI